jgi:hypothetical protein
MFIRNIDEKYPVGLKYFLIPYGEWGFEGQRLNKNRSATRKWKPGTLLPVGLYNN